jgi:hypothetical protein
MKAIRDERCGGPEVLELVDVPDPEPAPHDVVVEVEVAALNARRDPPSAACPCRTMHEDAPAARTDGCTGDGTVR